MLTGNSVLRGQLMGSDHEESQSHQGSIAQSTHAQILKALQQNDAHAVIPAACGPSLRFGSLVGHELTLRLARCLRADLAKDAPGQSEGIVA